jgi:hypothetical protein
METSSVRGPVGVENMLVETIWVMNYRALRTRNSGFLEGAASCFHDATCIHLDEGRASSVDVAVAVSTGVPSE